MRLSSTPEHHLTYCSNIHAGERWSEVSANLAAYVPRLKRLLAPDDAFGIGLRLSDVAARALTEGPERLGVFRDWLAQHDLYVVTLNGFPFGGFHGQVVKDQVYAPDWRTRERVDYTRRLIEVLADLTPAGEEGSISTSPISYKPWLPDEPARTEALDCGARHLAELALDLQRREAETGVFIHLDIEPEPDCLIENTAESVAFFEEHLLRNGVAWMRRQDGCSAERAEEVLRRHIKICYDTCHFAVEFERAGDVWRTLRAAGIGVGKVQLSAALHADLGPRKERAALRAYLEPFAESTYLHQTIERLPGGGLRHYPDLPAALPHLATTDAEAWRFHYHVPLFTDSYGPLRSTQAAIDETLAELHRGSSCKHLEIETYTWEVLPEALRVDLGASIADEYRWVLEAYDRAQHPSTIAK